MVSLIEKYANEPVWAVVGASNDRSKYGNRVYLTLRRAGYTVYPVNLNAERIEGDKAYKSVTELPEPPTVVDIVIPPGSTLGPVMEAKEAGARAVWFQPGAEDEAAIQWARAHGLDVIESCILVHHVKDPTGSVES